MEALIEIEDAPLTLTEEQQLAADEAVIERGLRTFYEVGRALADIRDSKLYRQTHRTFEEYCQDRWGMPSASARRLIGSTRVFENLESDPHGTVLPVYEGQARVLMGLEPQQQRDAWQQAVSTAPNGKITVTHVEQVVRTYAAPPAEYWFTCQQCDDRFTLEVWHCPRCDHHWDMNDDECGNCHEFARSEWATGTQQIEDAPPVDRLAPLMSSANAEWYTPSVIIDRVVEFFDQIDLDPCSNSHEAPNVPAQQVFTQDDDGLKQDWWGRVYMNPPYGDTIGLWVAKLCDAYQTGEIEAGIALLPGRVDTRWFRRLRSYAVCFLWGRLQFVGADNSAPFPSILVYLGDEIDRFRQVTADIGDVWVCAGVTPGARVLEEVEL